MSDQTQLIIFSYRTSLGFYILPIFLATQPFIDHYLKRDEGDPSIWQFLYTPTNWYDYLSIILVVSMPIYMLIAGYCSLLPNRKVIISDTTISAPKSLFSKQHVTIKFADIHTIKKDGFSTNYKLVITHANGKLKINRAGFKNQHVIRDVFDELNDALRRQKIYPKMIS